MDPQTSHSPKQPAAYMGPLLLYMGTLATVKEASSLGRGCPKRVRLEERRLNCNPTCALSHLLLSSAHTAKPYAQPCSF